MAELTNNSPIFSSNSIFLEEMYCKYLQNPTSVDDSWQKFFASFPQEGNNALKLTEGASWSPRSTTITKAKEEIKPLAASKVTEKNYDGERTLKAKLMIKAYREKGHFLASLDPLNREKLTNSDELKLSEKDFGFTDTDKNFPISIKGEVYGYDKATIDELHAILQKAYCSHIGVELAHIQRENEKEWLYNQYEALAFTRIFSKEEKLRILRDVMEPEAFEQFLHVKFPGVKRFSIEGGAGFIAAMEASLNKSVELGVEEVVIGMAHRGRLATLTKVAGKPYVKMFAQFKGALSHPEDLDISGDVKYHLGYSIDRKFANGKTAHISLTPNPSHLEAVNPVVAGKIRAIQDLIKDKERQKAMGVLVHGDAAFIGQGIVAESLMLSDLEGYKTGGTIHFVVNNQIGFTTNNSSARSGRYCTEFAKIIQAPIFHVNGDDPEAIAIVSELAAIYRQTFARDVIIDVVCYRLYGHNEGDEPVFTQPLMYKAINQHKTTNAIYAERLIAEGSILEAEYAKIKADFHKFLEDQFTAADNYKAAEPDWFKRRWEKFTRGDKSEQNPLTGLEINKLKQIGSVLTKVPEGFNLNSKIARQLEAKKKMIETGENLDWGTAEALAYGSLLLEQFSIRLSGQDARRGTFSHRHAVFVDQENEQTYTPLNNLGSEQKFLEVINSNLSEYGVLGFEYGYSITDPNSLVLWEGQFGDFVNGAQIIIDQFISASETKWQRLSGLVMLLPHGYEGQGPEHSSARLERFLQLAAENNIQVAYCSTPASYYHILRRQMNRDFRKPLIIMTPKSLLRHKLATSNLQEFASGTKFRPILPEVENLAADKVKKVVISTGKIYYDLYEAREKNANKEIALIRMEQLYPFAHDELKAEISKYKNAKVIWCQEEPKNMGAWFFVKDRIETLLEEMNFADRKVSYIGRSEAASPAVGYKKVHDVEQENIIKAVFI